MEKEKVFLDSNIVFSLVYTEDPFKKINLFFLLQKEKLINLYISKFVVKEVYTNVQKKIKNKLHRFETILSNLEILEDIDIFHDEIKSISLPDNDKLIFNTAVSHKMNYFITGNSKDFNMLYGKAYSDCLILKPNIFLELKNI